MQHDQQPYGHRDAEQSGPKHSDPETVGEGAVRQILQAIRAHRVHGRLLLLYHRYPGDFGSLFHP